jgi:DNA-binding CsgD family transcriptional regulator
MRREPACCRFTDPEAAEVARFGLTALRASAAIFYWVGGRVGMTDVEVEGVSPGFFSHYEAAMSGLDPLHVHKMRATQARVAQLRRSSWSSATHAAIYDEFLGSHGIVDVIDLLFYSQGKPFAGVGIMKLQGDPPVTVETLEMAFAMQRLVEFNLKRHARVAQVRLRYVLSEEIRLTGREIEVAELVAAGCSNGGIAERLSISLPTVKTHLLHILGKTECPSRTALAARLARLAAADL